MGAFELILIFALVLLIFGATRLPKLARSAGKAREEFKSGLAEPPDGRRSNPQFPTNEGQRRGMG